MINFISTVLTESEKVKYLIVNLFVITASPVYNNRIYFMKR